MSKFSRNVYLKSTDLDQIYSEYFSRFDSNTLETERIEVINSLGRITSNPAFAAISSPHYNASAMDGIVVRAKDTYEASEVNPVRLQKGIDFEMIDTGDVIPESYDSVIMIEKVVMIDDDTAEIIEAAYPWQDVRPVGEDIAVLEMIVPQKTKIRPVDIGALLAGGVTQVDVYRKMNIAVIPTGTEIVDPGHKLKPGDIIESNTRVIESMLIEKGMNPNRMDIVIDEYDLIKEAILEAVRTNDMILINAGSSSGSEDYTRSVIDELGEVMFHGINIRPGKPAIMGIIEGKPVIGIPGFPVSTFIVYEKVVAPLIDYYYCQRSSVHKIKAVLSRRIMSSIKNEEFVRVKLGKVGDRLIASPLNRGAGVTMSLVRADGVLCIPKAVEGLDANQEVEIELMELRGDIDNTIVSIGSHDIILDLLMGIIRESGDGIYFTSSHQGSFAGLMALKKNSAHIAPSHLLDENTGTYNIPFIEKYLGKEDYVLIRGLKRKQGFYVLKNNPKSIRGIQDIIREDLVYVNRQKGSGTRVLLDYLLKKQGISAQSIVGYQREMNTHMTVAAAVLSGSADMAMGIESVAEILGLDFIPIADESYDFVVRKRDLETEKIKHFIEAIKSEGFRREVSKLKGYTFEQTGKIIEIG